MKEKILADLYGSKEMNDLIGKMEPAHLREDLKQEVFLALCETEESKIIGLFLTNQLRFYVTRIVLNMIQSSTSTFFRKYRKQNAESIDELVNFWQGSEQVAGCDKKQKLADTDGFEMPRFDASRFVPWEHEQEKMERELEHNALIEEVEKVMNGMHWYTRELFRLYVNHGSAGKLIKAMKQDLGGRYIPKRTILDVVKKAKTELREKLCA